MKRFTKKQIECIKKMAVALIDDESPEYTRGIAELIADIDGEKDVPHGDRSIEIENELLSRYKAKQLLKPTET